jgi:hypothetical protein
LPVGGAAPAISTNGQCDKKAVFGLLLAHGLA